MKKSRVRKVFRLLFVLQALWLPRGLSAQTEISFTSLDVPAIFKSVFGFVESREGKPGMMVYSTGEEIIRDETTGMDSLRLIATDSGFVGLKTQLKFTVGSDSMAYFYFSGNTGEQNCHIVLTTHELLLKKTESGWRLVDTILFASGYDYVDSFQVKTFGAYVFITSFHAEVSCGGYETDYIRYLSVGDGKISDEPGLEFLLLATNSPSGMCTPPSEEDKESDMKEYYEKWTCACDEMQGRVIPKYLEAEQVLAFTHFMNSSTKTGKNCEVVESCDEMTQTAFYKERVEVVHISSSCDPTSNLHTGIHEFVKRVDEK